VKLKEIGYDSIDGNHFMTFEVLIFSVGCVVVIIVT
jgi:hypothetical protein